jgi:hypothetical protein
MGFGDKRKFLVRGVARSIRRIDGLGRSFRIVVRKDGRVDHVTVEAETLGPASEAQVAWLGAKLLDALATEMNDVVREAAVEARDLLTLRLVQPGTLPRDPATVKALGGAARRVKVH